MKKHLANKIWHGKMLENEIFVKHFDSYERIITEQSCLKYTTKISLYMLRDKLFAQQNLQNFAKFSQVYENVFF